MHWATILTVGNTGVGKSALIKAVLSDAQNGYTGGVLPHENATPIPDPTPARSYEFTDQLGRSTKIIDQNGTAEGSGADIRNVERGIRALRSTSKSLNLVLFIFNAANVKFDANFKALLGLFASTFDPSVLSRNFAVVFTRAHGQTREQAAGLAAAFTAELESIPGVRVDGGCVRFWQVELHPSHELRDDVIIRMTQERADALAAIVEYAHSREGASTADMKVCCRLVLRIYIITCNAHNDQLISYLTQAGDYPATRETRKRLDAAVQLATDAERAAASGLHALSAAHDSAVDSATKAKEAKATSEFHVADSYKWLSATDPKSWTRQAAQTQVNIWVPEHARRTAHEADLQRKATEIGVGLAELRGKHDVVVAMLAQAVAERTRFEEERAAYI